MKKAALVLILILICSAGSFSTDEIKQGQKEPEGKIAGKLINSNPGFETITEQFPKNWYYVGWFKPEVKFVLDKQDKHSGEFSAAIFIDEQTERLKKFGPPNWAQDITKNIPVGKKIKLTGYIKTENVRGIAPIGVQCWNLEEKKMNNFGTTQFKDPVFGTTDWTKVSFTMKVPENTDKIRILCMLSGTGRVWFDDVKLEVIK